MKMKSYLWMGLLGLGVLGCGQGPVQPTGISSAQSPIRRCIWTDHSVVATDNISYRVTAMKGPADGPFAPDAASASGWSVPQLVSGDAGGGELADDPRVNFS